MNIVEGNLRPLHDNIIVTDMEFGLEKTAAGILLRSDDGKSSGVHPRWAKVYALGPEQNSVEIGEWILLEHGRWGRGIKHIDANGEEKVIHLADKNAILMVSDEKPADVLRSDTVGAGSNVNFNIPGA
jgi:co-chaperonin GroES (HSP10)